MMAGSPNLPFNMKYLIFSIFALSAVAARAEVVSLTGSGKTAQDAVMDAKHRCASQAKLYFSRFEYNSDTYEVTVEKDGQYSAKSVCDFSAREEY